MSQAIHHHLCTIKMPQAKTSVLRTITLLAQNHIPELVAAFLDFSMPLDRYLAAPSSLTHYLLQARVTASALLPIHHSPQETQNAWCREGVGTLFTYLLLAFHMRYLPQPPKLILSGL